MSLRAACLLLLALLPLSARADRGALSVDAGGGLSAPFIRAPYIPSSNALRLTAPSVWLGGRYALSNRLELAAAGFWEPSVTGWHNGVTLNAEGSAFPGTMRQTVQRYGAVAGPRWLVGMVWRVSVGLDVGFSRRSYSQLQHIDVSDPGGPVAYEVPLRDFTANNLVLSPVLGLEWAAGDHWSVSFQPRAQLLVGAEPALVLMAPVTFSWSWYL
jgi:hypothetical protein